jgi:hypothetical protein
MIPNVIFVAANAGYFRYIAALTRSIAEQVRASDGFEVDVRLILHDVPGEQLSALKDDLAATQGLRLIFDHVDRSTFHCGTMARGDDNLFFKQSRYRIMEETLSNYEVACLLDADQLVVSPGFFKLFDLVRGTNQLIACNERFKWEFNDQYRDGDGKPMFPSPRRALKFHCSVPIFFQPSAWRDVLADYNQLALRAYEADHEGNPLKSLADIFTWNAAVERGGRSNDVRLFPMEVMTGVHFTYVLPQTRLIRRHQRWFTENGDEVYTLHGRMADPDWVSLYLAGARTRTAELEITDFDELTAADLLTELVATWRRYDNYGG